MSELHLFKTKRVFTLQVMKIKNFLIRGSTERYSSITSKIIVPLSVIKSRVIKRNTFVAKDIAFVRFSSIKIKKKIISTLIARDKLPVRTILGQHDLEFPKDLQECNYPDDLKHLGNKTKKRQKIIKNMKTQTHPCKKSRDKTLRHQYLCLRSLITLDKGKTKWNRCREILASKDIKKIIM